MCIRDRAKVKVQGKYKKQSGGHGQFGDVWMEFEPSGDMSKPYVFEEKIFGGSVPKQYFPAVEKGLQECVNTGVLAGYPVVGLKATLVDGSYHPVDSSCLLYTSINLQGESVSPSKAANYVLENQEKLSYIPGKVRLYEPLPLSFEEFNDLYKSNGEIDVYKRQGLSGGL